MGDAADDLERQEIDREIAPNGWDALIREGEESIYIRGKMGDVLWTTKNGQKIKFRNMDISHLKNVRNILSRNRYPKTRLLDSYIQWRQEQSDAA